MLAVNLKSVFLVTQAVLWACGRRSGAGSSTFRRWRRRPAASWGRTTRLPRQASSGLTHSYAALLAKEGITVNAIAPGFDRDRDDAGQPRPLPALIPVGSLGAVDEVANVVVMLASNGYITGQTINVNGGWYC